MVLWMVSKTRPDYEKEWRESVKGALEQLTQLIEELRAQLTALRTSEISDMKAQLAVLQVKSGVWGFIAGAIPSAIAVIYVLVKK